MSFFSSLIRMIDPRARVVACRDYSRIQILFFCCISLLLSVWQAIQAFAYGTSRTYMVQDDARQHVFWMQRWLDPDLFPNDLIADYFQSVAPLGYQGVYRVFSWLGFEPLLTAKILPGFIAIATTFLFFRLLLRILPVPFIAFLGCLFLNQALWLEDGIISGTPRAFVYLCLIGFLDGFLTESPIITIVFMGLAGLFYPQALLLAIASLTLPLICAVWKRKACKHHVLPWIGGVGILGMVLLVRNLSGGGDFGPVLSPAIAQSLPELGYVNGEYGRSFFFHRNPVIFWLFAPRSGFLSIGFLNPLLLSALALPGLLRSPSSRVARYLNPQLRKIRYFLAASTLMFLAAHRLLFQLHLPARYTYYSFRITLILLGSISIGLLLERWWQVLQTWRMQGKRTWIGISLGIFIVLSILFGWLPLSKGFTVYSHLQIKGRLGDVYEFLRETPKDTVVASLAKEADNIPTFAQRSVLAASEYAIPYHWGYYRQLRQRFEDLITAQYSNDLTVINDFMDQYRVDYWLVETWKLSLEEFEKSPRLQQFEPASGKVIEQLRAGQQPIFPVFFDRCTVVEQKDQRLLDAQCMRQVIAEILP